MSGVADDADPGRAGILAGILVIAACQGMPKVSGVADDPDPDVQHALLLASRIAAGEDAAAHELLARTLTYTVVRGGMMRMRAALHAGLTCAHVARRSSRGRPTQPSPCSPSPSLIA